MATLRPRTKLWVEADGRLVMSDYRLRLLELVAETGSLAQAAQVMRLSYRRAWGKVKELEANLDAALVESEAGGAGGGRTTLTPRGRTLVEAYRRFRERSEAAVREIFDSELREALGPSPTDDHS